MNTLRNTVRLIGRLGGEPEVVTFDSGRTLARFTMATQDRYKDSNGEWKENTQWHNISAWGKTADRVKNLLQKGQEIILEGKLVNQNYETKSGEKRFSTVVEASEFIILSAKNNK